MAAAEKPSSATLPALYLCNLRPGEQASLFTVVEGVGQQEDRWDFSGTGLGMSPEPSGCSHCRTSV